MLFLSYKFITFIFIFLKGLPVAFCLMPNRRATTYTEVFQRLKQEAIVMNKQFEPKRIVSDFETALVPAIRQEVNLFRLRSVTYNFNHRVFISVSSCFALWLHVSLHAMY